MTQDIEPLTYQHRTNIDEHRQFFAKINEIIANLAPTVAEAEEAIAQANTAISAAGTALSDAQAAIANANTAITTANSASAAAQSAAQTANAASAAANGAVTTANAASAAANGAVTTANAASAAAQAAAAAVANKQDALISGQNIRTVNGKSLVGSGNVAANTFIISPNQITEGDALFITYLRINNAEYFFGSGSYYYDDETGEYLFGYNAINQNGFVSNAVPISSVTLINAYCLNR